MASHTTETMEPESATHQLDWSAQDMARSARTVAPGHDVAILILRIGLGVVFVAHGAQKFLQGIGPTIEQFTQMGIPLAFLVAPIVATLELLGGLALFAGFFTRLMAGLLAVDMLGALLIVHLPNGFFMPGGIEFTFTLLTALIAIIVAGSGALSLDRRSQRQSQA